MLVPFENLGHVPLPEWIFRGFREVTSYCNLHDLDLQGYPFTWKLSKGMDIAVEQRIDKAMVSDSWILFPFASLENLVAPILDHTPILIHNELVNCQQVVRRFMFENA